LPSDKSWLPCDRIAGRDAADGCVTDHSAPGPIAASTRRSGFLLVAVITVSWGIHWPLIKVGLSEIPPFTFRGLAVLVGGSALMAWAGWRGERLWPRRREALALLWMSLCNVAVWQMLTAYALQMLPAGRAVVLAYTMPIWSVVLGALFLGEKIDRPRLVAIALGSAGMALLIGDDIFIVGRAPLGSLMILAAAFIWAVGTVFTKGFHWSLSLPAMVGWQLLIAAVPMLAAAVIFERADWILPSAGPAFALGYNILIASIVAYLVWFRLLELYPASIASISILSIPVVGLFAGALILGESLGPAELGALVLVIGAIVAAHRPWAPSKPGEIAP
jgi:drug/metabolite transporter (DMT)-like permease